ncbi:hypothetical protein H2203_007591 [Taxawa tesnikishii (nom. ined.)]|nr:hypothetical protein H2203_007591 [Dothideales sp. JES 119]
MNIEEDEAGRLKRFRGRFGRGWDAEAVTGSEEARDGEEGLDDSEAEESLLDLIANYGQEADAQGEAAGKAEGKKRAGNRTGGEK